MLGTLVAFGGLVSLFPAGVAAGDAHAAMVIASVNKQVMRRFMRLITS
jgi:hypothetical protein